MNNTKQCYFNVIIVVVILDWGNYFPYFLRSIYVTLGIICTSVNNDQVRCFSNCLLDIMNEVICCCFRMTFCFHCIIVRNYSFIYILVCRIAYNRNFFLYRWTICRLLFNNVTIIVVPLYCCFIVIFIRGGLYISFFQ